MADAAFEQMVKRRNATAVRNFRRGRHIIVGWQNDRYRWALVYVNEDDRFGPVCMWVVQCRSNPNVVFATLRFMFIWEPEHGQLGISRAQWEKADLETIANYEARLQGRWLDKDWQEHGPGPGTRCYP